MTNFYISYMVVRKKLNKNRNNIFKKGVFFRVIMIIFVYCCVVADILLTVLLWRHQVHIWIKGKGLCASQSKSYIMPVTSQAISIECSLMFVFVHMSIIGDIDLPKIK